ncbi:DNA methylase [Streptacidiphilus pinicola]|uniref:DNA methylase n=1 Tax=Streptacidiphilus pinicola TaxID=2219663 RepID=A0A2X0JXL0_9ACTN|nr:DNA cytosine methyltransferase [Streptacidiphilus pinicola]RAG81735.1 DNA methylase [Streptacidiphilus pinicola]
MNVREAATWLPARSWNGLTVLDAFCCAGGAGMGYWLAGFDVLGVDIAEQPNYPFRFVQCDAVAFIREHGHRFDLRHASPPCQFDCTLTVGTNQDHRHRYADLLDPTRDALANTGGPWVIEQPPGRATKRMRVDVTLCGEMFGLAVIRHRNFELGGWTAPAAIHLPHRGRVAGMRHGRWFTGPYFAVYGQGGGKGTVTQWQQAMGIHWTDQRRELAEAIPPAYTQWLGRHAADQLGRSVEAAA